MNKTLKFIVVTLMGFLIFSFLSNHHFSSLNKEIFNTTHLDILSHFLTYLIVGLPIIAAVFLLHSSENILANMGISRNIIKGTVVAFLFTLPMLIGYSIFFGLNTDLTLTKVFIGGVFAALFEELYFRGFLFGQIFRNTKLGFIPTILFGALLFAIGHLYQSTDLTTLIGIFLITALGAALFAWTYVEWDYNLWVSIGLHFFMNFHWMLFSAGENALGGIYANVFRFLTVASVIIGTIYYKKWNNIGYNIKKENLWIKLAINKDKMN